ncbi:hypothetical protein [Pleionea sp. CnH1-48]|uniref:hypothetical protein n=1 Tax=Pleionea sp. CnH1-48 TaxID=2954494 RepID=UPI002097EFC3|nr:hypothetical protein [Pleionea sp. CnH1-48]MCO7225701.1 hypothetical protein [Pleionea sp. CnH1-48]
MNIVFLPLNIIFILVIVRLSALVSQGSASGFWLGAIIVLVLLTNIGVYFWVKSNSDPYKRASRYLSKPVTMACFMKQHQMTEAQVNEAIGKGILKAYEFEGEVFIDEDAYEESGRSIN